MHLADVAERERLVEAGSERADSNEQLLPVDRASSCATNDVDATRSQRSSVVNSCSYANAADDRRPEERPTARAARATPRVPGPARPGGSAQQVLDPALQRVVEIAHVPDERERSRPPAARGRSPAARWSWSNQWNACATVTASADAVAAASPPPCRPAPRAPTMCAAHLGDRLDRDDARAARHAAAASACRSRPRGRRPCVPGRARSCATSQSIASCGYDGRARS